MVLAHTLPCSHTFCFGCIRDWLCHSKDCPNCRAKAQLKSAVPVKVLDNTINKVAEEVLSPEELEERQLKIQTVSILEQRLTMTENKLREWLDKQQKITLQIRPNK
nr:E3 ubiquitin-protein ligase RNF8-like [Pocillopora verrucosa]